MKLSLALPTRGRPQLLLWTLQNTLKHIRNKNTTITVLIDADDLTTVNAARQLKTDPFAKLDNVVFSVAPREDSLGEKINRVLSVSPGDIYFTLVDYRPCISDGFDEAIIEAASIYPDGYAYIATNLANLSFPAYQGVTAKLSDAMGGIYPVHFPYWFVDHWLDDVGRMIGRMAYCDIETDGSHRPATTTDLREPDFWAQFYDMLYFERAEQAVSIIRQMDEPEWKKSALVRNFELVRQRSCILNGMVRSESRAIEQNRNAAPPDERYIRIKVAAENHIKSLSQRLVA